MTLRSFDFLAATAVLLMSFGCTDKETTITEIAQCSGQYPYGACEAGQSCVEGTCVQTDSLCSPTNTTGACPSGRECFAGGCVLSTSLCSNDTPLGVCAVGSQCFEGACLPVTQLCTTSNPNGTCEAGATCLAGSCVATNKLCTTTNPTGACIAGEVCFEGACIGNASICGPSNIDGVCPSGLDCVNGTCSQTEGPDPGLCDTHIYTEQPNIGVRTSTSPPAAVDPEDLVDYEGQYTWNQKTVLTVDGLQFKDSDGDGELDKYEDWRYAEICRAKDLVSKMSLDQKIGLMSEGSRVGSGSSDGSISSRYLGDLIGMKRRYALIRTGRYTATELAVYLNNVQELLEGIDWGIPITITADPIHGVRMSTNSGSGNQSLSSAAPVSDWPIPLGLGAVNDPVLTRQFGDTVREEFMAMGFRWQLGPMVDSATEPRWERVQNTFGAHPLQVRYHAQAAISGFQGVGDGGLKNGIAATMKHFPGAGSNERGMDSHSYVGRYNVFPGDNFEAHLIPFQAAIDVGVAAVMPCYSIFRGQTEYDLLQVGAGFSPGLITDLLKTKMGFTGMVTGDWGAVGNGYNTESLSRAQRAAMWLQAGSHQFGSDSETSFLDAFNEGYVEEGLIDGAAEKILEMTFKLGLFEDPYVDEAAAGTIVRSAENLTKGFDAMKRAMVLLKNRGHEFPPAGRNDPSPSFLPLRGDLEEAQRCAADAPANAGKICVEDAFCGGVANSCDDLAGYAVGDSDLDGRVEVYFDGVEDAIAVTEPSDSMANVLGAYDYTSVGDGTTTVDVVQSTDITQADIAVLRITARKGTYFGLDDGVPLSFDKPFPGTDNDRNLGAALQDRNRVIDALRVRDGYTNCTGTYIPPTNPDLRIVLVMMMDRPGIVEPFVQGLLSLDEPSCTDTYPLVHVVANHDPSGQSGVDAFMVDFGASDRALLDVLFDVNEGDLGYLEARLPMELPRSDAAVEAQYEDLPADTLLPTFSLGAGQGY